MADKELQIKLTAVGAPQAAAEVEKVKAATENVVAATNPWITASRGLTTALNGQAKAEAQTAEATKAVVAATNPWITASRGLTTALKEQVKAEEAVKAAVEQTGQAAEQTEKKVRRKKKAVEEAGEAAKKAAGTKGSSGGGGGGGQGLLALSQSLQDLQYGIGGILNNIPQLVAGLGLGAGVAGVVQMAMVGAYNAMNLLKEGAATPIDWSKLTPEEEQKKQLDELTESLKKQHDLMERLADAWERRVAAQRAGLELGKQELAFRQEMAKLNGLDAEDPQNTLMWYDQRKGLRNAEKEVLDTQSTGKKVEAERSEEDAAQQEVAARRQAQRVKDLESRGGYEQMERDLEEKRKKYQSEYTLAQGYAGDAGLTAKQRELYEKPIREVEERLKQTRTTLTNLPTPDGWQPTGDAQKDAEAKQEALRREQEKAVTLRQNADRARAEAELQRRAADAAEKEAQARRRLIDQEQQKDDLQTEQQVAKQAGLPQPMPRGPGQDSLLLDPATRPVLTKAAPGETATPAPEAEAPAAESPAQDPAVQEMVSKLQAGIQKTSGDTRQMLESLLATLTDGQGDTAGELAMINQMYAQAASDQQNAVSYLRQAVSGIAQLNNGYAAAMGAMANEVQNANAQVAQLRQQVDALSRNRPAY